MLYNYGKKSIKKTRKNQGLLKYLVVNVQWAMGKGETID